MDLLLDHGYGVFGDVILNIKSMIQQPEKLLTIEPIMIFIIIFALTLFFATIINTTATMLFGPSSTIDMDIYINDFTVFREFRKEWQSTSYDWARRQVEVFGVDPKTAEFNHTMATRAGLANEPDSLQNIPPGVLTEQPDCSMASGRYEAEIVMFTCVERLLVNNNIKPHEVDILVVNCSLFNPTPSLCAMIINKFKMREDIITYNLSGMGCSAAPLAIQLASHNLKLHKKKHPVAIVVSTEILTTSMYKGSVPEFVMSNSLFRMNGSALVLTRDGGSVCGRPAPKWRIDQLTRLHLGYDDKAYKAIYLQDDHAYKLGVRLSKDLVPIASYGIKQVLTNLAPKILPITEIIRYILQIALYTVLGGIKNKSNPFGRQIIVKKYNKEYHNNNANKKQQEQHLQFQSDILKEDKTLTLLTTNQLQKYQCDIKDPANVYFFKTVQPIPNFKKAVDHFLIHPGGKAVVENIATSLNLNQNDIKSSLNVLRQYGNTSSTSLLYVLQDVEENNIIKNDQHALGLCLGAGMKINTLYLTAVNRPE